MFDVPKLIAEAKEWFAYFDKRIQSSEMNQTFLIARVDAIESDIEVIKSSLKTDKGLKTDVALVEHEAEGKDGKANVTDKEG